MKCACDCKCQHDAGTVSMCLPCAANRRVGRSCKAVQKVTPEQAAATLALAVTRTAPNTYTVPSTSTPGAGHTVTLLSELSMVCSCPWGFRAGTVTLTETGIDKRPCRHMLAVAMSGARYEAETPHRDPFARLRDHRSGCAYTAGGMCDCVTTYKEAP